jgi:hypothetical protein
METRDDFMLDGYVRHCERSEAIQNRAGSISLALDCFVASLLAMTIKALAVKLQPIEDFVDHLALGA